MRRVRREIVSDRQANVGQCEETVKKYKFKSQGFNVKCDFTLVYDQVNGLNEEISTVTCSTNTGKRLTPKGLILGIFLFQESYKDRHNTGS